MTAVDATGVKSMTWRKKHTCKETPGGTSPLSFTYDSLIGCAASGVYHIPWLPRQGKELSLLSSHAQDGGKRQILD